LGPYGGEKISGWKKGNQDWTNWVKNRSGLKEAKKLTGIFKGLVFQENFTYRRRCWGGTEKKERAGE